MVFDGSNTDVFESGMAPLDALNKAIDLCGAGVGGFAALIGARQSVVSNWRARLASGDQSVVGAEWCPAIERVTGGVVRCEMLNPAVDWAVVRGKANQVA